MKIKSLLSELKIALSFVFIICSINTHAQFIVNNDALKISTDTFRLTNDATNNKGQIWYQNMCDLSKDFTVEAKLNFGTKDGGADGIAFTFQNICTNVGGAGQGLGSYGISPSVIVEFDTYRNSNLDDNTNDHMGIHKNGTVDHGTSNSLAGPKNATGNLNFENGSWWPVKIVWTASSTKLEVYFNGVKELSYTGDIVTSIFSGDAHVYWGFTASTGGYHNLQQVTITKYPDNEIGLINHEICELESVQEGIEGFSSYSWTPDNGTIDDPSAAKPTFTPLATTWYYVQYEDACSTVLYDSFQIVVNPAPAPVITASGSEVCNGKTVDLSTTLEAGETIQWYVGGNSISDATSAAYTASTAGNYEAYVTSSKSCTGVSNAIQIDQASGPSASFTVADTDFCPGDSTLLSTTVNSGETIKWLKDGAVITDEASTNYYAGAGGEYRVRVTNADGCYTNSTSKTITENDVPEANITSSEKNFCPGVTNITLSATPEGASDYKWYKDGSLISGATASSYETSTTGEYSVHITNSSGCSDISDTISLQNATVGTFTLSSAKSEFCAGTKVTLSTDAEPGSDYKWFLDGEATVQSGVDLSSVDVSEEGTYRVDVTNTWGCKTSSNDVTITSIALPNANISKSSDGYCEGGSLDLIADSVKGATYEWLKDGASVTTTNDPFYTVSEAGMYSVRVDDGCSNISDEISVAKIDPPADAGTVYGSETFCGGNTLSINVGAVTGATSYKWTITPSDAASIGDGQGTDRISLNTLNKNVTVTVTPENKCGTGASSQKSVAYTEEFPCNDKALYGAYPSNICAGSSVTFYNYTDETSLLGYTPNWDFGDGASPATATGSGPHTVTYATSGKKTVSLDYIEEFTQISIRSELKTKYINVSDASVNTSEISGKTKFPNCDNQIASYSVAGDTGSTYQWNIPQNASIVSGENTNEISVQFTKVGDSKITVQETTTSGCKGSLKELAIKCEEDNTSIQNAIDEENQVKIYPNPSTGVVYINFDGNYSLGIYSIDGKIIHSRDANGFVSYEIVKPGIYTIKVVSENGISCDRVIVY